MDVISSKQGSMGASILRQCRRRTQSEPPKTYRPGKYKPKDAIHNENTSSRNSVPNNNIHVTNNTIRYSKSDDLLSKTTRLSHLPCHDINEEDEEEEFCELCLKEQEIYSILSSTQKCPHRTKSFFRDSSSQQDSNERQDLYKNMSLDFRTSSSSKKSPKGSRLDASCFPKLGCCRKTRRKACYSPSSSSNNNNNNNKNDDISNNSRNNYNRDCLLDYEKLSPTSSCDSSMYTGSLQTASSCLTTSSDDKSRTVYSESSGENVSRDSGFDEPPCYLHIVFQNHKCKGLHSCKKKDYFSLNMHLKALMNCMPKTFCEFEAIPHQLSNCSGVQRDPYLSKRRNAICETSDEMKLKFNEALCAFLTLRAMVKYEFL